MTPAGKLQERLKQRVQKSGGQYRKVRWEGRRGCPDCFVWWPEGKCGIVEVKAPGDKYSKLQAREVERMQSAGLQVHTLTHESEIDDILKSLRGCNT